MTLCSKPQVLVKLTWDWSHHARLMRLFKDEYGTSLVVQGLRIRLPMQGTQVRALVRDDPTCCGATKPVRHSH